MSRELKNISAYCVIPYRIMYDKDLTDGEVRLYIAISSLANQRGYCFASNRYLAKSLGKSGSTIKRAMRKLEEKGFIKRDISIKDDDSNMAERKIYISYDNVFDRPEDENELGVQKCTGGCLNLDRGQIKNEHTPQVKSELYNNISNNNINNNIREREEADLIVNNYNLLADELGLSKIMKLSSKRKTKLLSRLKEIGFDDFMKAIDKIRESSFLKGKNERGWKVNFDWLIENDTNILKILEDKYKDGLDEKMLRDREIEEAFRDVGVRF